MTVSLPEQLTALAKSCPFPLYVVGGTVRDALAGLKSSQRDYDICAPASAQELAKIAKTVGFAVDAVYKNTGTVKLTADGQAYEFTSFRSDEYVRGRHVPERIYFTDDIRLDAVRRDFKCNAVYYDICAGELVDPLGGIADIKGKILSTVAPASKVFGEDGLRLMRLARIAGQTGFTPDPECMDGAKMHAALIADIAPERVWTELKYILDADEKYGVERGHYKALEILCETGVTKHILPELWRCKGQTQRADYHSYDVLEHSLRAAMYADPRVRLAALLHDIGKPVCKALTGKSAGHEETGAEMVRAILSRLKAPTKAAETCARLIELHMFDIGLNAKLNRARRFIVENYDIFDELLLLKQADFSACKDDLSTAPFVTKYRKTAAEMREKGLPFTVRELDIKGDMLIKAGVAPQRVGGVLKSLLLDCIYEAVQNERESLLQRAEKMYI